MRALALVIVSMVTLGCASYDRAHLVGDYHSPQPCSLGSDYDLSLHADGSYLMVRTLPEGVGPQMPDGVRAGFEERGRWHAEQSGVILRSADGKTLSLRRENRDGHIVLSDGEKFGLQLEKQSPNQSPEPTSFTASDS